MGLRERCRLSDKVERYRLYNICKVISGCHQQSALFGIGRTALFDPRQDHWPGILLSGEHAHCSIYVASTYADSRKPVEHQSPVHAGLVQVPVQKDNAEDDL